ncbi:MAG: anti-sigma factor antagonist [Cyanobacteria bacterium J06597_16]
MSFTATLETRDNNAIIKLAGDLDASTAADFKSQVEAAAATSPKHLVLDMAELDYMASAGLRVLIFAKQKMGQDVEIYVVAPQELVLGTIEKTGFHHSVHIVEKYEEAVTA